MVNLEPMTDSHLSWRSSFFLEKFEAAEVAEAAASPAFSELLTSSAEGFRVAADELLVVSPSLEKKRINRA